MPEDYFGEPVAARYDADEAEMFDDALLARTVDFLLHHAAGGPVLEFGIGTGRVALPLSARGVTVHGIDLSEAMIAQLRGKPGADRVHAFTGDFAHHRVDGSFGLVYLVFNTIGNLTSQDEQVACFVNAAEHLRPGGRFVIEVGVPDLQRLPFGERIRPFSVTASHLGFDEYDVVSQGLVSHHYYFSGDGAFVDSTPFRYVWPSELDLMARLAGMSLVERWASWDRAPFTATSTSHVSVWQRS